MRLILLLCSLICYGMAYPVLAGPLADRLAGELARQAPEQALPLDEVQRLDRRLIAPDSLYPAWQRYPLRQLQAIYRYQQECGTDNDLPAEWLPLLRALCGQGAKPSTSWFAAHPIYPLGGSSAADWLVIRPPGSMLCSMCGSGAIGWGCLASSAMTTSMPCCGVSVGCCNPANSGCLAMGSGAAMAPGSGNRWPSGSA
ncbi:DUF3404 domain-containing protein [Aeromonas veronii]|uniref:DUF3404 domain-containing protein n=1 Tax=Aeromonas veronii TaxID=654 RepID=UPI00223C6DAC|nr:DUF3404 domain-containing protein [Aeromonas veronii]